MTKMLVDACKQQAAQRSAADGSVGGLTPRRRSVRSSRRQVRVDGMTALLTESEVRERGTNDAFPLAGRGRFPSRISIAAAHVDVHLLRRTFPPFLARLFSPIHSPFVTAVADPESTPSQPRRPYGATAVCTGSAMLPA